MPKVTELYNHHMQARHWQEPVEKDGSVENVDVYEMIFSDRQTGDVTRIKFEREARDELTRQLTQGIVLAGGQFPKV